ncbi:MAG TPA: PEP-CTERM sorting domain-containing protein [Rhizomicrobium sp.]|nr:PEP-CTERM sorting domain-containing protein [Rhizomicrobium sp.]
MSKLFSGLAVAAVLVASSTSANAGIVFSSIAFDGAPAAGEIMVQDFDNPLAAGYTMSWSAAGLFQGPLVLGIAAPPVGDTTKYLSVFTGGSATLTAPGVMHSLSIYIGSLDTYNSITFNGANGFSQTFGGAALALPANGDQFDAVTNRRFYFDFDANDLINQVVFASTGNSFEFDNIAVNDPPAEVPEPVTLSVFATGMAGAAMLRRRRKTT